MSLLVYVEIKIKNLYFVPSYDFYYARARMDYCFDIVLYCSHFLLQLPSVMVPEIAQEQTMNLAARKTHAQKKNLTAEMDIVYLSIKYATDMVSIAH